MVANRSTHFVVFPFMAKGHTIPLLYLARLLSRRHRLPVTVFTTPANSPSVRATLDDPTISIVELSFPANIDGVPPGVENTDQLPSMSVFFNFLNATKLLRPEFEEALENIKPPASCVVSDAFLGWTQDCAQKLGIPRIGFYGMSSFSTTMYTILGQQRPHALTISPDEPFQVPNFPALTLTRNDFDPIFSDPEPRGPWFDFMVEQNIAMAKSHCLILNSFYELEAAYTDYWNKCFGPKALCLGPLCLAKPSESESESSEKPIWRSWLDRKLDSGAPVLYVAFGTQAELSPEQVMEIDAGLERSGADFLWVTKPKTMEVLKGFYGEKLNDRGIIVAEWVDQMEILRHRSIRGFLSHCGWNSVTESICAGVPILALPLMAEQHLNARLVEEIGVGLRIRPSNGSVRGFVKSEEVEKRVRELMVGGGRGDDVREKMEKMGEAARSAMREGGSSWRNLDQLINDVSNYQAF